ncbi:GIY-YIG nuclease family protein [Streptomyces sp. SCL15-4]|uniref:GIY-YIG nuclease family protein n=1 Tax=Streptomyces sp. SCL15-4 TaxID=2967221 RepID=UPI00296631CB|nr:GIY-YIG nuclease family protein [Streptomyces sp. SCL15-4]
MTKHLEVVPDFQDTFERPAWWHRQQWLSSRPAASAPRLPMSEKMRRRAYEREGIPYPGPERSGTVQSDPQPVRSATPPHRSPKWKAANGKPHTYLVTAEGTHLVKIGIAKDPRRRLKELQTGQPMDLFLMWAVEGDYEQALHDLFAAYRHRGEWFDLRELGDPVAVVTDAMNEIKGNE